MIYDLCIMKKKNVLVITNIFPPCWFNRECRLAAISGIIYSPGSLSSLWSHCSSFEDRVPVDFIYGYLIFQ